MKIAKVTLEEVEPDIIIRVTDKEGAVGRIKLRGNGEEYADGLEVLDDLATGKLPANDAIKQGLLVEL